jgi:hypothetical protein
MAPSQLTRHQPSEVADETSDEGTLDISRCSSLSWHSCGMETGQCQESPVGTDGLEVVAEWNKGPCEHWEPQDT